MSKRDSTASARHTKPWCLVFGVSSMSSISTGSRMMRVGLRGDAFDFRDGDHRQESYEQQEAREEQSERAEIGANIHPGRLEIIPVARQEFAVQRNHDDD